MTDRFRFRWGIPEWDVGSTDIPNPIFQYYSSIPWTDKDGKVGIGISNTEAMFILHLASFRFESERGKSIPSLTGTLRQRMGYASNQGIINIAQSLEHKQLIIISRAKGQCSEYNFRPFSNAIMSLWKANQQSTKVDDYQPTKVDDHPSTKVDPKKNKQEEKPKKKKSSAPSAKKKPNGLLPDTQYSRMMFGRLQENARAAGRGKGPRSFKTLEQKQKFDKAAAKLNEQEYERALMTALKQGINDLRGVVNYIAKWDGNHAAPSLRQDHGKYERARKMTLERLAQRGNQ